MGFWRGDVSTDPPFTLSEAVVEGMQKWRDPVTQPMETHLTGSSTWGAAARGRTGRAPHPLPAATCPPKLAGSTLGETWRAQAAKALMTSCWCHTLSFLTSSGPSSSPLAKIPRLTLPSCPGPHLPHTSLCT